MARRVYRRACELCNTNGLSPCVSGEKPVKRRDYRMERKRLRSGESRLVRHLPAEHLRMDPLLSHRPLEFLFNAGHFTLETAGIALSVIDFDGAGNTVAILLHPLIALLHH